jgi:Tfp pilus assembly protein PilV
MQRWRSIKRSANRQRGMTIVELMIAMVVLVVGLLALMSLVITAVGGNSRNKTDTGGTLVAQVFMEGILSQSGGAAVTVKDCANTTFTVSTAGPATAGTSNGANLDANGNIDFTQAVSGVAAGYKATYVTCGTGGTTTAYDVRWNVRTIDAYSQLVTISAQSRKINSTQLFRPPVSLRSIKAN